jgi:hypothetical protein
LGSQKKILPFLDGLMQVAQLLYRRRRPEPMALGRNGTRKCLIQASSVAFLLKIIYFFTRKRQTIPIMACSTRSSSRRCVLCGH